MKLSALKYYFENSLSILGFIISASSIDVDIKVNFNVIDEQFMHQKCIQTLTHSKQHFHSSLCASCVRDWNKNRFQIFFDR